MKRTEKRCMAALTAAVMAALALPAGSAFADDSYLISPSGYLQDRTGTLTMTVSGEREVQVKIEKDTPDGIILYYDTTLYDDGTYEFLLDSCEYNIGTGEYDSSFTVTVQDKSDSLACYTQKNMVVVDPGFTTDASSSAYLWNVTLEEGETGQASADVTDAALREDGVWYGESSVNLQYVPYVLGDVNSDGSVDTSDIFESMYYVARKAVGYTDVRFTGDASSAAEKYAFAAADVDESGVIDSTDIYYMMYYIALNGAGIHQGWDEILAK